MFVEEKALILMLVISWQLIVIQYEKTCVQVWNLEPPSFSIDWGQIIPRGFQVAYILNTGNYPLPREQEPSASSCGDSSSKRVRLILNWIGF